MSLGNLYPAGFFVDKLDSLLREVEASAPAPQTELRFFVTSGRAGWIIRADDLVYGCFDSPDMAFLEAVHEAQAARLTGCASSVLTQAAADQPYRTCWIYGSDSYPPG